MTSLPPFLLPADALERWRSLEARRDARVDPIAHVRAWLERLRARMICSGGRLGPLLLATGLCEIDAIVGCVRAQLDAGSPGESQLLSDVEADLMLLSNCAPLDLVEELSAKVATLGWVTRADDLHGTLAERLLDAGRSDASETALTRITWHGPLLHWIKRHGASLSQGARERLVARAERLVSGVQIRAGFQVGVFVQLGVLKGDRTWLDRARQVLSTLSPDELDVAGSGVPLATEVALGLARLGALDDAMAILSEMPDAHDRWNALLGLVKLLPVASNGALRASLIDELVAGVVHLDDRWWPVIEAAPETLDRALATIEAIPDDEERVSELCYIVEYVDRERARNIYAWMLGVVGRDPGSPSWATTWKHVLEALTEAGCEALVDVDRRRHLVDTLLAHPEHDLWNVVAPYVPDDRASTVLELSCARLAVADHYSKRDKWIAVGIPLLARVPVEQAERWREIAGVQMAQTGIEDDWRERLGAWSFAQQRAIVLARLAQHQHEFLPHWLIEPWAKALEKRQPAHAKGPHDRAEARRALDALTATTAWPTLEQIGSVFDALVRCDEDENAVTNALAVFAD